MKMQNWLAFRYTQKNIFKKDWKNNNDNFFRERERERERNYQNEVG